jgi:thymidylate synthase (FAD)
MQKTILDKGFLTLVDVMGDDSCIVQAARVSYGKGTKTVTKDNKLIRYLMRHNHWTPFEMPIMRFHVKCPIFVARQWHRHRTASINEESARYSEIGKDFYSPVEVSKQSTTNKQGSEGTKDSSFADGMATHCREANTEYKFLLEQGVAREMARILLPQAQYTNFYWQCNLRNIFNFIMLRNDPHAQYEIRVYAEAMEEMVAESFPIAYKAYVDYVKESINFTVSELICLEKISGATSGRIFRINKEEAKKIMNKREISELSSKIERANDYNNKRT